MHIEKYISVHKVSHEIKNALIVVKEYINLLEKNPSLLPLVNEVIDSAISLLKDLSSLEKIEKARSN